LGANVYSFRFRWIVIIISGEIIRMYRFILKRYKPVHGGYTSKMQISIQDPVQTNVMNRPLGATRVDILDQF